MRIISDVRITYEPIGYGASADCEIDEYLTWRLNGACGDIAFVLDAPRPELHKRSEREQRDETN